MKTRLLKLRLLHFVVFGLLLAALVTRGQELRLVLPIGHTNGINSSCFSPDGNYVLTASTDNTAKVWSTRGTVVLDLQGHTAGVSSAKFSPDGLRIITASDDSTFKVWDAKQGTILLDSKANKSVVSCAIFSPNGKQIATTSTDKVARLWDAKSGRLLVECKDHTQFVRQVVFSPDGTRIATASHDGTAKVWDAQDGRLLLTLKGHFGAVNALAYSPDGTHLVTGSADETARVWDAQSGAQVLKLSSSISASQLGHTKQITSAKFSPNGNYIVTASLDKTAKVWNAKTGAQLLDLKGHQNAVYDAAFSQQGGHIVTAGYDNMARIWDLKAKQVGALEGHSTAAINAAYSPDESRVAVVGSDNKVKVWDARRGVLAFTLPDTAQMMMGAAFSSDSRRLLTTSGDCFARIWDARTGALLQSMEQGLVSPLFCGAFSPDGARIAVGSLKRVFVRETQSGKQLFTLKGHKDKIIALAFNANNTRIATASFDKTARLWDAKTGKEMAELAGHTDLLLSVVFSPDGRRLVTTSRDKTAKVWDAETGKQLLDLKGHKEIVMSAAFSPDGSRITTTSADAKGLVWDAATGALLPDQQYTGFDRLYASGAAHVLTGRQGSVELRTASTKELLYQFIPIDSTDYLVVDKYNRYDGSPSARQLLYFSCGAERIGLDQVKDQLWVPNLSERLLQGEILSTKRLTDLDLCNLTPEVRAVADKRPVYHYQLTPHKGGLSEAVLLVNGIEVKHYNAPQLTRTATGYDLVVSRAEVQPYLAVGQANTVSVKAYTQRDHVASRGAEVVEAKTAASTAPPNLYAIMLGISDYQGTELDLKYAAKDAEDLARMLGSSARKFLNTDKQEHVFIYRLTSGAPQGQAPTKANISRTFAEIGRKAAANDILLIFFAGHGVVGGDKKQFYFLSADASPDIVRKAVATVGISTQELADWMQPAHLKVQKRVLILDACNSGQAINDLIKVGQSPQRFSAARGEDQAQQIKAIEKLNEQTGMFILAAAASNQRAYETSQYSQGLLTYALLEAIKNQPAVLENHKYLNVHQWLNTAGQTVSELGRELGVRQQPQVVQMATNFNLGVVDDEVLASIVLTQQKTLFGSSNFQNKEESISSDNLGLNALLDQQLSILAARGSEADISFTEGTASPEAYSLTGRYEVHGQNVKANIYIRKGKTAVYHFEENGTSDNMAALAAAVAAHTVTWVIKGR